MIPKTGHFDTRSCFKNLKNVLQGQVFSGLLLAPYKLKLLLNFSLNLTIMMNGYISRNNFQVENNNSTNCFQNTKDPLYASIENPYSILFCRVVIVYSNQLLVGSSYTVISYHDNWIVFNDELCLRNLQQIKKLYFSTVWGKIDP